MADFQTVTAGLTVADLAWKVVKLVRSVVNAPKEASELCDRTRCVGYLANIAEQVVNDRRPEADKATRSPVEWSILKTIEDSLAKCRQTLLSINEELLPFEHAQPSKLSKQLAEKYKFVCSKRFRSEQEDILGQQIANLNLSFNLLISSDLNISRDGGTGSTQTLGQSNLHHATVSSENVHGSSNEDTEAKEEVGTPRTLTSRDSDNWTVLHHAAKSLNYEDVDTLLQYPDIRESSFLNAVTSEGETALTLIASHADDIKSISLADILLGLGSDVNWKDPETNHSALYRALDGSPMCSERVNFVLLLVYHGADVEAIRQDFPRKYEKFEESPLFIERSSPQVRRKSGTVENKKHRKWSVDSMKSNRSNSIPELARSRAAPTTSESHERRGSAGERLWRKVSAPFRGSDDAPENCKEVAFNEPCFEESEKLGEHEKSKSS